MDQPGDRETSNLDSLARTPATTATSSSSSSSSSAYSRESDQLPPSRSDAVAAADAASPADLRGASAVASPSPSSPPLRHPELVHPSHHKDALESSFELWSKFYDGSGSIFETLNPFKGSGFIDTYGTGLLHSARFGLWPLFEAGPLLVDSVKIAFSLPIYGFAYPFAFGHAWANNEVYNAYFDTRDRRQARITSDDSRLGARMLTKALSYLDTPPDAGIGLRSLLGGAIGLAGGALGLAVAAPILAVAAFAAVSVAIATVPFALATTAFGILGGGAYLRSKSNARAEKAKTNRALRAEVLDPTGFWSWFPPRPELETDLRRQVASEQHAELGDDLDRDQSGAGSRRSRDAVMDSRSASHLPAASTALAGGSASPDPASVAGHRSGRSRRPRPEARTGGASTFLPS